MHFSVHCAKNKRPLSVHCSVHCEKLSVHCSANCGGPFHAPGRQSRARWPPIAKDVGISLGCHPRMLVLPGGVNLDCFLSLGCHSAMRTFLRGVTLGFLSSLVSFHDASPALLCNSPSLGCHLAILPFLWV